MSCDNIQAMTTATGNCESKTQIATMNCFPSPKMSPRRKGAPPALTIPTILEIQDVSGYLKTKDNKGHKVPVRGGHHSDPGRRAFRLGSDAEESTNSSSQRTTPSYSTGNSIFDFEYSLAQSDSCCTTPSPLILPASTAAPGVVFLDIPRDPFHPGFTPISNSHSSDKLVSGTVQTPPPCGTNLVRTKIQVSRSCSMLTRGVFGGGTKERMVITSRPSSAERDSEMSSKSPDTSRKSSDTDGEGSIFTRLMQRWHTYQNGSSIPAHALFLKYSVNSDKKKSTKKKSRSNSDTDAVEKTVKERLRHLVRRNTESVLKKKNSINRSKSSDNRRTANAATRPTPEEARLWQESFDALLASPYGVALFRAFLRLEYNEENLAFYMACEKFKALDPSSHKKILAKAQKIYDEYVRVEAPKEVNLDSITRATTVTNLSNPNRHCFDHAQRRVRHVLEKDVYPRFLHFNLYTQLLETCSDAVTELKVAS